MKKILAAAAAVMLCLSAGCGKKTSKASESDTAETTSASAETTSVEAESQTEASSSTDTDIQTTSSGAVSSDTVTTTAGSSEKPVQPDPLGGGVFKYNEDGAVVFTEDPASQEDTVLISAAQALFESACRTEWSYTVGCPYELDSEDYDSIGGLMIEALDRLPRYGETVTLDNGITLTARGIKGNRITKVLIKML